MYGNPYNPSYNPYNPYGPGQMTDMRPNPPPDPRSPYYGGQRYAPQYNDPHAGQRGAYDNPNESAKRNDGAEQQIFAVTSEQEARDFKVGFEDKTYIFVHKDGQGDPQYIYAKQRNIDTGRVDFEIFERVTNGKAASHADDTHGTLKKDSIEKNPLLLDMVQVFQDQLSTLEGKIDSIKEVTDELSDQSGVSGKSTGKKVSNNRGSAPVGDELQATGA